MTLAACTEHQPMHQFGKGWVCAVCGAPCQPKPLISKEWFEKRAALETDDMDPTTGSTERESE